MLTRQNQELTQSILQCSYDLTYQTGYETNYDVAFVFIDDEDEDTQESMPDAIPLPLSGQLCLRRTKSSRNTLNHRH